jgi:shikimate kinase
METTLGSYPADKISARGQASLPRLVFLVGFMGAGKSAVGKSLAAKLGWQFEDLDERIVARERSSIEQIFRELGEPGFRRAEHAALHALLAEAGSAPCVVALGGGAFVQSENAALLAQIGAPAVFLDAPVDVLFRRCQQEKQLERPLRRSQEEFGKLYDARRPHYLKAALRIETSHQDIEAVAQAVARALGLLANRSPQGDMS